jgi:D-beta-D-heptose 7-phosphate kinase/D-beta-D-heptose 1-phosphate adenosyltransferase
MKDSLIQVIENFKKLKVLVIGDAILDTYILTTPEKFSREAPVPVFNIQQYKHQCGGAANTAVNVAALGAETYFLTVTGKDACSRKISEILRKNKVHAEYIVKDKTRTTISKKRVTASSNILMRIDAGTVTPISEHCEKELLNKLHELREHIDVIIISDYNNGVITNAIIDGIKTLKESTHIPVIVDARDLSKYRSLKPTAVKPNYEEILSILNVEKLDGSKRLHQVLQLQKEFFEITGAQLIAATFDADGVLFLQNGKAPHRILCEPLDNKRAIGAGDTFTSALSLSLALKIDGNVAAEIAASAAAIVIQKDGTASCTNNELKSYFNVVPKHILKIEALNEIVKGLKKQGKKIVFTNGCFDILHSGHIYLLNNARKAGDVLIVGVNSDASITKLKGNGRPINNFEDRIMVLAGLQSVDYIILFEEESPVDLIKTIHPDIFIKGGNYTEQTIPEAHVLKKIGCRVKIVPYMEEHSTTHIIDKIRDAHFNETAIAVQEF